MLLRELIEQANARGVTQDAGYASRPVKWEIVLYGNGSRSSLRRIGGDKGEIMSAPYIQRSGVGSAAFPAVDTAARVLGVPPAPTAKPSRTEAASAAKTAADAASFIKVSVALANATGDPGAVALRIWLQNDRPGWGPDGNAAALTVAPGDGVCFRLDLSDPRVHDAAAVKSWWNEEARRRKSKGKTENDGARTGRCLVCDNVGPLARLFPQELNAGSLGASPGALISVNSPAFGRQSQEKLDASPVCFTCAQNSVSGLQDLLDTQYVRSGNRNAVKLSDDRRLVFWVPTGIAPDLANLLNDPDPKQVKDLLAAPGTADQHATNLTPGDFTSVVLGLNNRRVVISGYHRSNLADVTKCVTSWLDDMTVPRAFPEDMTKTGMSGRHPIWQIEQAIGNPKVTAGPPGAGQALWEAALFGTAVPRHLFARAVARERVEAGELTKTVGSADRTMLRRRSACRIALIALMLTRLDRTQETRMTTPLHPAAAVDAPISKPAAATLGRLFALIEHIQVTALGNDINAPVGTRWIGRASTSPRVAYPSLLRTTEAHLGKIDKNNIGAGYRLRAELRDLVSALPVDAAFPSALGLIDQGRWFLGLHQQRAKQAAERAAGAAAKKAAAAPDAGIDPARPDETSHAS